MPDKVWHDMDVLCAGIDSSQQLESPLLEQAHWLEVVGWNDGFVLASITLRDEKNHMISFHLSPKTGRELHAFLGNLLKEKTNGSR